MDRSQPDREGPQEPLGTGFPPWARTWSRRLVWAVGALAILYFVSAFALSRLLDPARLANWVEPRVEAAVNRDVAIESVGVRFLPFGVRLEGIVVEDPTGLAPNLARLDGVDLRVALLPLLRRRVRVDRIAMRGANVALRVDAEGRSNFGDLAAAESPGVTDTVEASPLTLEVRSLGLSGTTIDLSNLQDSVFVHASGIGAEADVGGEPGADLSVRGTTRADVQFGSQQSPSGEPVPVEVDFDVVVSNDVERLVIREARFGVGEVGLALSGTVDNVQDSVRALDLRASAAELSVSGLLAALPDSIRDKVGSTTGSLDVDLQVAGPLGPDRTPAVTGMIALSGVGVESSEGVQLAEDVSGSVRLEDERVLRPDIRGNLPGGTFEVAGTVQVTESGRYDLAIKGNADLEEATRSGPETALTMAGRVALDGAAEGPTSDPASFSLDGFVDVEGLVMEHPALGQALQIDDARFLIDGTSARVQDMRIRAGADQLTVTGVASGLDAVFQPGMTPEIDASVRGARLDLVQLSAEPPPDTALTYGRLAFARLGNRSVRGRSPEEVARDMGLERPDSLPLTGELRLTLDTLIDRRGRSESVQAVVQFGPGFVRIPQSELRRYGGTLSTRFDLALGTAPDEPFSLLLDAQDVDAAEFLGATTPLGRAIRGTVTIELDVAGALDGQLLPGGRTLVGAGRFHLRDGGLAATPITERITEFLGWESLREPAVEDWQGRFIIEDGTFVFEEATLTGAPGTPHVSGRIGPDGLLDLLAAFALPTEELGAAALRRIGVPEAMTAELMEREGLVQALLRISGNVQNPVLAADPDASPAASLAETAKEEVREEVQEQIEERRSDLEERATGLLRGFLRRGDSAAAPADSTRPDSVPPLVPPDTVPVQDSVPADSIRVDTLPADTIPEDPTAAHAVG